LHQAVGINSRLDTLQAAVLNVKLGHLEDWTEKRRQNAARYEQLFSSTGLDQFLRLPSVASGCDHVWNQYTIRVPEGQRDALRLFLSATVIGTEVYYPVPLHLQECFRSLGYVEGGLPHTELAASEVLSLPIFPELAAREQQAVVDRIGQFFRRAAVNSLDNGTAFDVSASSLSNV
jgi:dTDP-4-amino-4,6-dideoxygalactose transaminase